ncbi:MAG TPA: hypothetical protein VMI52_06255 [Acetobacteraceae bacterium]|nr:hypothetical protein [Acetobacteraceae bacterium]
MPDSRPDDPDALQSPMVFVRHGDPEPTEWMARHPGWIKVPATMVPRAAPKAAAMPSSGVEPASWPGGTPAAMGAPVPARRPGRMTRGGSPPNPAGGPNGPRDPVATYQRIHAGLHRRGLVPDAAPDTVLSLTTPRSDTSSPQHAPAPATNPNAGLHVSDDGVAFIFDEETRGKLKTVRHPHLPSLASDVTLGEVVRKNRTVR